jgi:threonine/homoserine/homoserine lactone efflux protein
VGIAALLRASGLLFAAVKFVGAGYLILLGVQALRSGLGLRGSAEGRRLGDSRQRGSRAFRQGLISNLSNPKMAVFFTSLLPQFVANRGVSFAAPLLLGLVFCAMTLAWLTGYAVVVARVGDFLRRPTVRRVIEGLTGTALIGLGLRLATEHR